MIPSPHDIEISNEESTKIDTLSQNFYQRNHGRVPVLRLERLRLGHDCISSVNGRVDLKILKKASPGLFPKRKYTKRADGKKGEIDSSDSGHHEKVKKKQEKKSEENNTAVECVTCSSKYKEYGLLALAKAAALVKQVVSVCKTEQKKSWCTSGKIS